jgi:hypothetical protein
MSAFKDSQSRLNIAICNNEKKFTKVSREVECLPHFGASRLTKKCTPADAGRGAKNLS